MPFDMSGGMQAIVIGDNVYIGGGLTLSGNDDVVMVYSLVVQSWRRLPPYESIWFGMAAVNNQLVLVGGEHISHGEVTNMLSMWDELSQRWTHPFPEMPTSRESPSAISYQQWLVVAGGHDRGSYSDKVELLDTVSGKCVSGKWYEASPLATQCVFRNVFSHQWKHVVSVERIFFSRT